MAIKEKLVPTQSSAPVGDAPLVQDEVQVVTIRPSRGWASLGLAELWEYRELLYFLAWRDVKVRYKQTAIGATWAVLQPLLTMAVFTAVFGKFARIPSDGLPYPIFAYSALLPWNFFSGALTRSVSSVVGSANLITKVYFPRLTIPIAATVAGAVDFAVAFVVLLGMMLWFRISPTWGVVVLPFFLLLALAAALAAGLWFSALNVKYRDVGHAIPVVVQLWMFASPLFYPVSLVPAKWRLLYSLNPMVGVIEGFRWALLGKARPDLVLLGIGVVVVALLLLTGVAYFRRTERAFGDVI
jgi:lipopolysaccharide transport system permease protein